MFPLIFQVHVLWQLNDSEIRLYLTAITVCQVKSCVCVYNFLFFDMKMCRMSVNPLKKILRQQQGSFTGSSIFLIAQGTEFYGEINMNDRVE